MATYAQFKHVELYKIGHGKNRVPNAPKSCIAEIFNGDTTDGGSLLKNSASRTRIIRDTPTRPRDTHSRLFGQVRGANSSVIPMVTDTIRSNIQFGEGEIRSPAQSPKMNGSASSTPSRHDPTSVDHCERFNCSNSQQEHNTVSNNKRAGASPVEPPTLSSVIRMKTDYSEWSAIRTTYNRPKRNPVTGDGFPVLPPRRRHPGACLRGADPPETHEYPDPEEYALTEPEPTHRYITREWPPEPANYYVESTSKAAPKVHHTPYTLLGLNTDDPELCHPVIDPDSMSPQLVLDRHWPPFPAQHYLEPTEHKKPYHPLPPYAFVGMTSALGDRPKPDYKYNPIPALDGAIDPYLIANNKPPPTLFRYERDGPIPDLTPLQTEVEKGPHTLTGFPPIFPKHVPGYLFSLNRHAEDFNPKTYYVDYIRGREMEGNPITGDGYKSMNGQINMVTTLNSDFSHINNASRVPPGGYSSGLW